MAIVGGGGGGSPNAAQYEAMEVGDLEAILTAVTGHLPSIHNAPAKWANLCRQLSGLVSGGADAFPDTFDLIMGSIPASVWSGPAADEYRAQAATIRKFVTDNLKAAADPTLTETFHELTGNLDRNLGFLAKSWPLLKQERDPIAGVIADFMHCNPDNVFMFNPGSSLKNTTKYQLDPIGASFVSQPTGAKLTLTTQTQGRFEICLNWSGLYDAGANHAWLLLSPAAGVVDLVAEAAVWTGWDASGRQVTIAQIDEFPAMWSFSDTNSYTTELFEKHFGESYRDHLVRLVQLAAEVHADAMPRVPRPPDAPGIGKDSSSDPNTRSGFASSGFGTGPFATGGSGTVPSTGGFGSTSNPPIGFSPLDGAQLAGAGLGGGGLDGTFAPGGLSGLGNGELTGAGGLGAGGVGAGEAAMAAMAGRMPMMPLSPGMGGAADKRDRSRASWLAEDEDVWGVATDAAPPVL